MKPHSPACERNREPILAVLRRLLQPARNVLEIGSGTGQHAVYFAADLPHLTWHPSDLPVHHAGIRAWIDDGGPANVKQPISLDVDQEDWPQGPFDAVFTANTLHIVSWPRVQRLIRGAASILPPGGSLCVYGPFNYNGRFTSQSNADFNQWLLYRDPDSGIRDIEKVTRVAAEAGLALVEDNPMPANNRLLHLQKEGS
ncbi:MAG: DUF938 domain-containing protein [Acidobacteriota bacterium]|nr:DUF938 domain-containing protein [Acidobacteriota bacterium]